MLKSKAEQTKKAATPHVDISLKRKANYPATSRSDIFSKLVKLVGLSDHRGSKTADRQEATGGPAELVAIGCPLEHSPVTLHLSSTTSLPTSSSKETLRSSSDSNLAVSALDDGYKHVQGTDLSSLIQTIDGSWTKHERKSTRRKAKTTPLSEPATFLTTIPEIASVFERTSLLPDLSFPGDSKYYPSEDALMDTDSIRARTAIALARAQLEHSRPASHNRKIERSSNQMMMLPNELEEYKAQTRLRSATIPSHEDRSVWNEKLVDSDRDVHVMQKELEQSQAMVLTLMAAKEVKSQRATARKKSHSPPRVDLPTLPNKPSQGLYQAGDVPPCPPPSIPLPRLPPSIPLPPLPPKITVTGHKSEPTTPKLAQFGRSRATSTSSAYKGLPTVYRSDDETLKHIDLLMQSLLVEHPEQEDPSRKFCHSLPSRSGRGRSGSHSTTDGGRQSRRPRMAIPPEPMPVQRPAGHAPVTLPPQVPHTPTPRAYCELRFGSLPGPTKMAQFKPISFSYYDVLPSSTEDGMLNYSEHDTHSHRAACNLTFSGGPTGQYSQ